MHKILWEALIAGLYPTLVAGLIWYTRFELIIEKQFIFYCLSILLQSWVLYTQRETYIDKGELLNL